MRKTDLHHHFLWIHVATLSYWSSAVFMFTGQTHALHPSSRTAGRARQSKLQQRHNDPFLSFVSDRLKKRDDNLFCGNMKSLFAVLHLLAFLLVQLIPAQVIQPTLKTCLIGNVAAAIKMGLCFYYLKAICFCFFNWLHCEILFEIVLILRHCGCLVMLQRAWGFSFL